MLILCWHLIAPPDFSGEVGLNHLLGLVTSCCGHYTACCWLGFMSIGDTLVKAIRVWAGLYKKLCNFCRNCRWRNWCFLNDSTTLKTYFFILLIWVKSQRERERERNHLLLVEFFFLFSSAVASSSLPAKQFSPTATLIPPIRRETKFPRGKIETEKSGWLPRCCLHRPRWCWCCCRFSHRSWESRIVNKDKTRSLCQFPE